MGPSITITQNPSTQSLGTWTGSVSGTPGQAHSQAMHPLGRGV